MTIRVLGVSGSPRLGATHRLVNAALLGARQVTGTTTSYVSLAGRRINPCNGCGPCMRQGSCVIDDDMQELYGELLAADAVILGTPVYYGAPTALCKAFMERVQGFGSGEKKLRLKVGGGIATGQGRNGGQETALQAIALIGRCLALRPQDRDGRLDRPGRQGGVRARPARSAVRPESAGSLPGGDIGPARLSEGRQRAAAGLQRGPAWRRLRAIVASWRTIATTNGQGNPNATIRAPHMTLLTPVARPYPTE